jgi:hypothetical protein
MQWKEEIAYARSVKNHIKEINLTKDHNMRKNNNETKTMQQQNYVNKTN